MLQEVFAMHREGKDFENFYQSQILWDETMAHAIDGFLRENPGHQMVIIAGKGHVMYGSGIPKRAYRLTGKEYAILISSPAPELDPDLADYVLFAREIPAPSSPFLGVKLEVKDEQVTIMKVTPGSPAGLAGMKKGDVIVSVDDVETGDIGDIKLALFGKESGDTARVKIRRKRFLFGDKEMELDVTFP
jgi:membrane-associated protease RseP (regulator of RpoE activity)